MTIAPDRMRSLSQVITEVKPQFLDNRGIGVRRFAQMTTINRPRLERLLSGKDIATIKEMLQINDAMTLIDERYKKGQEIKKRTAEKVAAAKLQNTQPKIASTAS